MNSRKYIAGRNAARSRGVYVQVAHDDRRNGNQGVVRTTAILRPPLLAKPKEELKPEPKRNRDQGNHLVVVAQVNVIPSEETKPAPKPVHPSVFTWENRDLLPGWALRLLRHLVGMAPIKADRTVSMVFRALNVLHRNHLDETPEAAMTLCTQAGDRVQILLSKHPLPATEVVKVSMTNGELVSLCEQE